MVMEDLVEDRMTIVLLLVVDLETRHQILTTLNQWVILEVQDKALLVLLKLEVAEVPAVLAHHLQAAAPEVMGFNVSFPMIQQLQFRL